MTSPATIAPPSALRTFFRAEMGTFIMALVIISLSVYLILPMLILFWFSFDVSKDVFVPPREFGFSNWSTAFANPRIPTALWNSFLVWFLVMIIAFPISVAISMILARTKIPFSQGLEFFFWIAYMFPALASTIGWMMMLAPTSGFVNVALEALPSSTGAPSTSSAWRASSSRGSWRTASPTR